MIGVAAWILAACSSAPKEEKEALPASTEQTADTVQTTGSPLEAPITAAEVDGVTSATHVANSPTFNGVMRISPRHQATISLTMGGKIHTLEVMPGQAVRRGETVATIDNPEYIELQQTYLDASAQLEFLEKEYQRQRNLGEKDAASQKRVQQSKAEYLSMKARFAAADSRLKTLGVDTQTLHQEGIQPYLHVKAPLNGYVTRLNANPGKYLEAGEPICDLIDKSQLWLQLTVYEKDIALMHIGDEVAFRVNGMGKETFQATITSIDQAVDPNDYSIKVYARVTSPHHDFRPGMYVRAKVK